MRVFKFGGASVKDASAVKNVGEIIKLYPHDDIVVVVSAIGKTTNALEEVTRAYFNKRNNAKETLQMVEENHLSILKDLFPEQHPIYNEVNKFFDILRQTIKKNPSSNYDYEYDQIVTYGELLSTAIISAYLNEIGINNKWVDIREVLKTDNTYRVARVDFKTTSQLIENTLGKLFYFSSDKKKIVVTQGFIGSDTEGKNTSLGREGSDYTAGILAYLLDADEVTIWKDVSGLLNADPKWFDQTELLEKISYREAIELSYYGATIIHPKTIKPLQNKGIPLKVKSFLHPKEQGTIISRASEYDTLIPSFIFKMNQVLISILPKDFSFIIEEHLSDIYGYFAKHGVTINMMQNSAISFSVCVDNLPEKNAPLMETLKKEYEVKFNEGLELVTIRHYDQATIDRVTYGKDILVEQKSKETARMVMMDLGWFENDNMK